LALLGHCNKSFVSKLCEGPLRSALPYAEQVGGFVQTQREVAVVAAVVSSSEFDKHLQSPPAQ
jgi:hypothetical protein